MIKMQLLQPELKKIQEKHKGGDRQEMNAELMAFYQENSLNPLGGCLPLLVQAPVFLLLFRLIQRPDPLDGRGVPRGVAAGIKCFDPDHLDSDLEALPGPRRPEGDESASASTSPSRPRMPSASRSSTASPTWR